MISVKLYSETGVPEYAHPGDSGFDLRAKEGWELLPGEVKVIKTGLFMEIPRGYELQVRTRSGSPLKRGFVVANSPGTVDSNYRGEIGVILQNISPGSITIEEGERIAQGVVCPVEEVSFVLSDSLSETSRGSGAYNSTGVK